MRTNDPLAHYDGFLVDIDGVLVRGAEPLPGAAESLAKLSERGRVLLLTNNSTRSREQHAEHLRSLGFEIDAEDLLPTSYLAAEHLRLVRGALRVWVLGEDGLREELLTAGHRLAPAPSEADAVVVGMDRSIDYQALSQALDALRAGAQWIATNEDGTYPVPGGLKPGAGAMVGALRGMGFAPDVVIGKPSPVAYDAALRHLAVDRGRVLMIGDRLETDIAGGTGAGLDTALVLGGISTAADVEASPIPPTWIADSFAALVAGALQPSSAP